MGMNIGMRLFEQTPEVEDRIVPEAVFPTKATSEDLLTLAVRIPSCVFDECITAWI